MTDYKEYRVGNDKKLYNFNIDREPPNISRIVDQSRWGDGSDDFPTVGQKYTYQIRVWGTEDAINNRFPIDEGPGDPGADEPVAVDTGDLVPEAIVGKAENAILTAIATANSVKDQVTNLLGNLTQVSDSRSLLSEEANNLRALILEAKRVLAGGSPEEFTPPTKEDAKKYDRRLQSNGTIVNFNIDRKKPYRDIKRTITSRGETIENANVRLYGDLADLDQYYPLTLEV